MKRPAPLLAALSAALFSSACLAQAAPVSAEEALARSHSCLSCHGVERKVVGPAFRSIAARYAGKPEMAEVLAKKIRQGGGGAWGPVPMPANSQVSEADARKLSAWILGLK